MKEQTTRTKGNEKLWLGLGLVAGLAAGRMLWRRWRLRQASPLKREDEVGVALVTGASSGIGEAYARRLAREGYNLVLVARREARLRALADELAQRYGVEASIFVVDLADPAGLEDLEALIARMPDLLLLVNNAGFGIPGDFAANDIEHMEAMIRVHVLATVRLTRAALGIMLAQGRGAIVNVSSVAAFYPIPGGVTYGATKSYLNAFTESLHQELVGTGVRVQALCPGFTRTDFQKTADIASMGIPGFLWLSPEVVVEKSLRDLRDGRVISVPGWGYRALILISRLIPRQALYVLGRWIRAIRGGSEEAFDGFPRRTYGDLRELLEDVRYMWQHRAQIRAVMRLLEPSFRERLMLAVTQVNGCRYCAQHHAKLALEGGLSQEEIADLLDGVVDQCPPYEMTAIFYAQHWADQEGIPDPAAWQKLISFYGLEKAEAIEIILRMIKIGNYAGNTFDYILYRISGGRWGNVRERE